jgi:hypothetical protein
MLRDLGRNENDEPDKELKEILEPKVTESVTTEDKRKKLMLSKKSKTLT